ncbi:amino acid ABC transporter permease [Microvirga alba]|uniref:Amino acid ABC transporter permease n=1 Tax=Microvirga alba TaxID=2791025 RepID=A0A931BSP3_9HYPH|nr:amino acid ABC transporter permease [Microvirga alba]MBF9235288.1 amino acid ABC transporter permease [Microvirga alba]
MTRPIAFLRKCISSPLNALITLVILFWLLTTVPPFFDWAVFKAVWNGQSSRDCANVDAACWLFIRLRFQQILYGGYPATEHWRIMLCGATGLVALITLSSPVVRNKVFASLALTIVFPVFAGILLRGGVFGLAPVATAQWGGLMLTLVVALWTIASALPFGLGLALARRSKMPVVANLAIFYIDVMRGLPLVGLLFLAIVLFPLFVPPGVEVNALVRTLIAFSLFNAAIMAEVIRGGIQSVPKGQYEAAISLGLSHWQAMALSVIPQAIRAALPGIVNVSISIMKETTIILMAGMFDFLGVLQGSLIDPDWLIGDQIRQTAYFFAGLVFFVICFSLSRYSVYIERKLSPQGNK